MNLTEEQADAVERVSAISAGQAISLTGNAGAGKTVCLKHAFPGGAEVTYFTAMTGKAAQRITEATGFPATTLHAKLYFPPGTASQELSFTRPRPAPGGIVVVDESSMVTPGIAYDLEGWRQGIGGEKTGIVYVGDDFQLPPILSKQEVEVHGTDYSIFGQVKGPRLTRVMRSDSGILQGATEIRERGKVLMRNVPGYTYSRRPVADVLAECAADGTVFITWRNTIRMEAARQIRRLRGIGGAVPTAGEPILLCKNGQTRMNGEIVTVRGFTQGPALGPVKTLWLHPTEGPPILVTLSGKDELLDGQMPFLEKGAWTAFVTARRKTRVEVTDRPSHRVQPDDDREAKEWRAWGMPCPDPIPCTWGYALTAHKAQGSEYDRVVVYLHPSDTENRAMKQTSVLPDGKRVAMWQRWTYTAITRAKHDVELVIS